MDRETILVIEDDSEIIELISHHLAQLGFAVESVDNGMTGLQQALANDYALIVLDVMLPGLGGLEVCKRIREAQKPTLILILSGKSDDLDKILGLELGADDYVTKPFNVIEFRARVGALLRRGRLNRLDSASSDGAQPASERLEFRELVMDLTAHRVTLCGKPLELPTSEYALLRLLLKHQGNVVHRKRLLEEACETTLDVYDENLTTHISRLRAKLAATPGYAERIVTVRGVGYRFEVEDSLLPKQSS